MNNSLKEVVNTTQTYLGLVRKRPIEEIHEKLLRHGVPGPHLANYGDDAAVIPFGDQYLLFAADGMMTTLLMNEPYAAGKASVMVTVNDIYSMGGTPIAMVNVLAGGEAAQRTRIIEGIRKGCEKLNVPMVGGHLHPDASPDNPALSVAILGQARHLLRSHLAHPGDALVFAADLDGRAGCDSVVSWDANSGKSTAQLLHRLEALPIIAENHWANACKDVSNAGLLGTAAIMMENSGRGAVVDVPAIPCPAQLTLLEWIVSFQSFGFILSVPPEHTPSVIHLFQDRSIAAAVVGAVTRDRKVFLRSGSETELLFDFERDKITGIVYRPGKQD